MPDNRSVLITGASRGIGLAIAERFASEGMRLYINCKNSRDELEVQAARLSDTYGVKCVPLVYDVSSMSETAAAFDSIPSLDMVISSAGVAHFSLLQDTSSEDFERVISTDLTGTFLTLKYAVPLLMKSDCARIISISSVWGTRGAAMETAYSAAKGGLDAMTRSLARELAPSGIPVNAIACGVIDTDMNRRYLNPEDLEALKNDIPAGRLGTPEEVAELAYMIANAPVYMTGQIVGFDGGWMV